MKDVIRRYIDISEDEYAQFESIGRRRTIPGKQLISTPQTTCRTYYFIEHGFLRGYRIRDGVDYTHHFYYAQWFATDFQSYLTEQPGELYIETLTDVECYEFNKYDLLALFSRSHPFEKLGRIIAEKAFLFTVEKWVDMQVLGLEERYKNLLHKSPDLFQQVPQKYIASYLGVSEQSLSRIKSRIAS